MVWMDTDRGLYGLRVFPKHLEHEEIKAPGPGLGSATVECC